MKTSSLLLPALLLCSTVLAPAQEMNAAQKGDIQELMAQQTAREVLRLQESLGDAFNTAAFLKQLERALSEGESLLTPDRNLTISERMVEEMYLVGIESRDYDSAALLARLSALLGKNEDCLTDRKLSDLSKRVRKSLSPLLKKRERAKEQAVLDANAERPEVTTLSNGVQMEVMPGEGKLSEVNRITMEKGPTLARYLRITRQVLFEALPDPILAVADEVPAGAAWIFWIPAEVTEARCVKADDAATARNAALSELAEAMGSIVDAEENDSDAGTEEDGASLQKIYVWKDSPDAPIQACPDLQAITD